MKKLNYLWLLAICALGFMTFSTNILAADAAKPVPDKLTTCPVSGDKLDGDMGKPYVFTYKSQEVKLCCAECKKEFDKDPAKFMKKIRAADKKSNP